MDYVDRGQGQLPLRLIEAVMPYSASLSARPGGLVPNNALARKLAALFWRVMVKGMDYAEEGLARYEAKVIESNS